MASVNTQLSIAVHLLSGIAKYGFCTSEELAGSVNANPAFIKRILAKLSKASLIVTSPGKSGGCSLAKKSTEITLLDIYNAVEAPDAFAIHTYPAKRSCVISSNIKSVMGDVLKSSQRALEDNLKKTSLSEVLKSIQSAAD